MWEDEFQTRAQDLIRAIEQVEEELMETNEKFAISNDVSINARRNTYFIRNY